MPYNAKTLVQHITQAQADIESRLPGSYARVQEKTLNAIAYAQGGAASGLDAKIAWYARQVIPSESEPEKLAEWAKAFGVPRKLASKASGPLTVTVTAAVTLAAGTRWQRPDGITFEMTQDAVSDAAGQLTVTLTALEAGVNGNTPAGVTLAIVTPQAGVQSTAILTSALSGGADIEPLSRWAARLHYRFKYPPAGGTSYDYVRWALECPGVTRAWFIKGYNGADVGVTFVMDDNDPIIPTGSDVDTVSRHIAGYRDPVTNQWAGQPIGPEVITFAPEPVTVDMSWQLVPNNATTQAAAAAAISQFFTNSQIPGGTLYVSKLAAAVSDAAGVTSSKLLSPADDVTCEPDELLMPGVSSWQ